MKTMYGLLLTLVVLAGCNSPCKAPLYGVGDRVIMNDQIGVVIDEPYCAADGSMWYYDLYCRSKKVFSVPENRLQIQQHIDWNEPAWSLPPKIDIQSVPHLAPPQTKDKTT